MVDIDEDVLLEEVKALKDQGVLELEIIASLQEGMGIVGERFEELYTSKC